MLPGLLAVICGGIGGAGGDAEVLVVMAVMRRQGVEAIGAGLPFVCCAWYFLFHYGGVGFIMEGWERSSAEGAGAGTIVGRWW